MDVPLTGHGNSEASCWAAVPSQCTCIPQKYMARGLYNVLTLCAQVPWSFGKKKKARRKTNSSIHYCYTIWNKSCSAEEPSSPPGFRSWSSASNLMTHFPTFPVEIHLTCFILRVCPSFIHRPACRTISYPLIHPTSLGPPSADLLMLCRNFLTWECLMHPLNCFFFFPYITRLRCRHTSHLIINLTLGKKEAECI